MAKVYFPKVREARLRLAERAAEILESHLKTIEDAAANGNFKEALESQRWLLEHMPVTEDGDTLVDRSVDTQKAIESGPKGPAIQIGIAIAPPKEHKALPPVRVIDVEHDSD